MNQEILDKLQKVKTRILLKAGKGVVSGILEGGEVKIVDVFNIIDDVFEIKDKQSGDK